MRSIPTATPDVNPDAIIHHKPAHGNASWAVCASGASYEMLTMFVFIHRNAEWSSAIDI